MKIATINIVPTKAEDNNNKDFFYDNLERLYDIVPKNCIKIIIGNKNAKLRSENTFRDKIGKKHA